MTDREPIRNLALRVESRLHLEAKCSIRSQQFLASFARFLQDIVGSVKHVEHLRTSTVGSRIRREDPQIVSGNSTGSLSFRVFENSSGSRRSQERQFPGFNAMAQIAKSIRKCLKGSFA